MHRRRNVHVGALVVSPQEVPSRPNLRLAVVGLLFLALFGVMVLRLWSLQVIGQKTANAAVNQNRVRVVSVPAARGQILDRNDRLLVGNQVQEQIVLSRYEAETNPAIIPKVAALVGTLNGTRPNDAEEDVTERVSLTHQQPTAGHPPSYVKNNT